MTGHLPKDVCRDSTSAAPECGVAFDDVVSIAEAAAMLFVSRQHVMKLIDGGLLPLRHRVGKNRRICKADVLAYHERKLAEVKAWLSSQTEDADPPGQ